MTDRQTERSADPAGGMGDDELFQVKNHFYLGAYQQAINEATQSSFSDSCRTELDCLVNRSYIGMGNFGVRRRAANGAAPEPRLSMRVVAISRSPH